ncbi:hypothetical protein BD309DRAFT_92051 [Dichomitus squalens]|uniref:Uncharacterized protein n=1 Tax=Dichomitus squalens TaxID=114155 RepID=A0A4Q9NU73_9APHY|nr:hypothetical protein BD309DRAFT_92051 [Dichomitus squalens]TBU64531.1 hypothetical protein BD310DRAFT_401963 [Dichomitus squalens]
MPLFRASLPLSTDVSRPCFPPPSLAASCAAPSPPLPSCEVCLQCPKQKPPRHRVGDINQVSPIAKGHPPRRACFSLHSSLFRWTRVARVHWQSRARCARCVTEPLAAAAQLPVLRALLSPRIGSRSAFPAAALPPLCQFLPGRCSSLPRGEPYSSIFLSWFLSLTSGWTSIRRLRGTPCLVERRTVDLAARWLSVYHRSRASLMDACCVSHLLAILFTPSSSVPYWQPGLLDYAFLGSC